MSSMPRPSAPTFGRLVAIYSGVLDDLRRVYAGLDESKCRGLSASDFS